jgi:phosphoglycolate phosphatase
VAAAAARPAFDHVAFDLDGTLLDTGDDLLAATNHMLAALGRPPVHAAVVRRLVGEGARRLVEKALATTDADVVDRGLEVFMAWYGEHCLDATAPYPGMVEVVDALRALGCHCSVLTNKPEAVTRRIVDGLGLAGRFVAIVGGDTLPTRKPDPAGLDWVRQRTGTPAVRTLLVGDSGIDLRTARAAGVAFCGVAWGFTPDGRWAEAPERVIATPRELLDVVAAGSAPT